MQFEINTTTAKTTRFFKHFINFIPQHTCFVMCQYSLGIGLSLQVTIHLPNKYMSKPGKPFSHVSEIPRKPTFERNINHYFTVLEINDRLYTWPIIICRNCHSVLYTYLFLIFQKQRPKRHIQVHPKRFI